MNCEQNGPRYRHERPGDFVGHFYGHDVYVVGSSLIARWGNTDNEWSIYGGATVKRLIRQELQRMTDLLAITAALATLQIHRLGF